MVRLMIGSVNEYALETCAGMPSAPPLAAVNQAFWEFWLELRGDRAMPAAGDINPAGFRHLLPHVRCMRWDGPERVVFTLWGTGLGEWLKVDPTGQNVFDLIPKAERSREKVRLENLHRYPCAFVQQRSVTDVRGTTFLFEFLTLPVAAGADGAPRMIGTGAFCSDAPLGRADADPDQRTVQRSFRYIDIGFGVPAE
ncbi:PAS domain-containing protein [Pyruvatibacter mobilis]|uniref:PAS domain-containing protein n=1 Tax=Pyruvatibacter mobilis TaxID=1712261 RepID=UPI003BAD91A3